jgi:hypothetical protein
MMKRKILIVTAMLAVMVAMTGIAAANPFNLQIIGGTNPLLMADGDSVTLDLHGDTFTVGDITAGTMFDLTSNVECLTGCVGAADVTVAFASTQFGPAASGEVIDTNALTISKNAIDGADAVGATYKVTVTAGPNGAFKEIGVATRGVENIPEFPTVALPLAAVIGLVFFFQQKKNKKE